MSPSTLTLDPRTVRVVEFLRANAEGNAFFTSVLSQFDRKGSLSEAQLASVERNINRPRPVREVQANPVTELGMYRKDGVVFRVKRSKQSGNLYAMRYNPLAPVKSERFVYERGGVFRLSADAQKAGHEFGICCVCGAELSDPVSVERGIGPICVQRI